MIQNVIQKSQGDGFCSESVDCNCYGLLAGMKKIQNTVNSV